MKNLILAALVIVSPIAALANAPSCNEQSVGTLQCMAGKECECKFFRASAMAGTPDRFGWDCGILRPTCPGAQDVNVTQTPAYNGPSSVGYGISTSNTTLSNSPSNSQSQNQSPSTTLQQQQQSPTTTNTTTTSQVPTQTSTQTGTQSNNQNSTQNH